MFKYQRNGVAMECGEHTRERGHYLYSRCVGCGAFLGPMEDRHRQFIEGIRKGQVRLIPPKKDKHGWYTVGKPRPCLITYYNDTPGSNTGSWRPIRKDGSLGEEVRYYCDSRWPVVPALVTERTMTVFAEGIEGPIVLREDPA